MPKDLIPGSPDSNKYPHNKTSKECLLRCRQYGEVMEKILFEKSRVFIKTPDKNHHCFYQAVLTSLHQYISDLEGFHKYTAVHLKYQMLIHLIENLPNTELMKQIFDQAWYKIMCFHACLKAWILKFLHTKEWGDAKSMLGIYVEYVENKNHTDHLHGL